MIKNQFALLAGFLLLLFTVSCNPIGLFPTEEPPNEGQTLIITPAPGVNETSIVVGDTLVIQIPTFPTEGYQWQVRDLDSSILVQEVGATYAADASPDSAGGIVTLKFKAVGPGKTTLSLEYTNAGSATGPAFSKNTFGMTITVLDSPE